MKHLSEGRHWSIFQRGWGKWGRQREEGSEHVERLWQMSNTEASFRGDGGSEAGRGRREANMLNVYDKCPTLKHLSEGMGEVRQAEGGEKRTCWTSMTNVQHWSIFQRGWGKWGRQREERSEHVERLWQMSNTEASFRGDGGSEAGRGRREANMLNVYDKCPTLKHLSEGMGEVRQAEGGEKRTCWTSMTNVQHWSIFQRGWGKWGRQREEGSEHVERLWQMSNTEASFTRNCPHCSTTTFLAGDDGRGWWLMTVVVLMLSLVQSAMPWNHINGNTCIKKTKTWKQLQTAVLFLYNIWMWFLHRDLGLANNTDIW